VTDARAVGKAAIVMVALVFVWGYAWILSKMALAYCAPLDFATIRIALATTALFPALLCRTGDATLIAARVIRTKGVHFVIEVERVAVPQTQDRDADIIEATASIQALFEKWIREHPEQWMWSHRRWG